MNESQLTTRSVELAPAQPSILQLIQGVTSRELTSESVSVVREMLAVQRELEASAAKKAFTRAFVKLQGTIDRIFANKKADRYSYAPFEEIMTKARPALQECGFSISFDTRLTEDGKMVTALCHLEHEEGHSKTNQFTCRTGTKLGGVSEAQADGAASTYARRFALCHALNIIVETDNDGRNQGGRIDREQVEYLRGLMAEVGSVEANVLAVAGVKRAEDLNEQAFEVIRTMLEAKRKKAPTAKPTDTHPADQEF